MSVRLVLADDHRVLRDALVELLAREPDFEIVGEAGSGAEALEQAHSKSPDVLVLDIAMPDMNGIEVARKLTEGGSRTRVLMLSTYGDKRFVQEAVKAGAAGYVSKAAAGSELARAVRAVAAGHHYFSPEVTEALVAALHTPAPPVPPPSSVLGRREREVLAQIANGARAPQIAAQLGISVATVEAHRRNIMRKLGLHSVVELTKYALREGLASL